MEKLKIVVGGGGGGRNKGGTTCVSPSHAHKNIIIKQYKTNKQTNKQTKKQSFDQRNHNRILHGIEMLIMNISIPQQDIGIRISLPAGITSSRRKSS